MGIRDDFVHGIIIGNIKRNYVSPRSPLLSPAKCVSRPEREKNFFFSLGQINIQRVIRADRKYDKGDSRDYPVILCTMASWSLPWEEVSDSAVVQIDRMDYRSFLRLN